MSLHTIKINIPLPYDDTWAPKLAQQVLEAIDSLISQEQTDPFWVVVTSSDPIGDFATPVLEVEINNTLKEAFSGWRVADLYYSDCYTAPQAGLVILFNTVTLDDILSM